MKDKSNLHVRIKGSIVYLRPVMLRDAPMVRKWHDDPELMRLARVGGVDLFTLKVYKI